MIVEVVEEEAGIAGTLGILLPAAPGTPSVGVTKDGRPHERIGSHVAETKVLHQSEVHAMQLERPRTRKDEPSPDGLSMHRGLSLPPPPPQG